MEKIYLKESNEKMKYLASDIKSKECTCYICGACLECLIFLPLVGIALSIAVGAGLVAFRNQT